MAEAPGANAELLAEIAKLGEKVRELKTSGASGDEVKAAVAALIAAKENYTAVTGEEVPGSKPASKKDKKKKKQEKKPEAAEATNGGAKAAKGDNKKQNKGKRAADKEKQAAAPAFAGPQHSFPAEEEGVLQFWNDIDAFQTSLKFSEGKKEFTFYDGPPFATGQPHHGHILAGTIKDVVTRYAHQTGHHVERRFGWDCHGLPIEYEIDKTLKITGPEDVMRMGIDKYNEECRSIVMRYSADWRKTITRLGRWIDFDKDYKTMYPWFMESVWWVFKQVFDKGLVYRGYKVMPFSTALSTPLSNFEANQDMHDVQDPSVTAIFSVVGDDASFLAWTTTPWTLPSNLSLCVHPDLEYVKFKDKSRDDKVFWAGKSRLVGKGCLFKEGSKDFEVLETKKGSELVGMKYEPLFPYFYETLKETAFRVISDTYVTDDSGTGIVHNAPGHGEDDFRVCLDHGVVTNETVVCPVNDSGKFTDQVSDFAGVYIKDADKPIIKRLQAEGKVFKADAVVHAYAHCWRSGTPLIRKTVESWFIRVESVKDELLENNEKTRWVPDNIRQGRFHNWLKDARDWAISRNRYWGTPIPLWVSDDGEEVICIGSVQELEELSGVKGIEDLHREHVDKITIPSKQGKGVLRRVPQVFDCWFESGSMPYAQKHYPFENKERFEGGFPADFIAEGIDQTRGWFYTLLVIGTIVFKQPPWKNLIVNGLVLAGDGKKMSKRLKNYPDPGLLLQEDGADALRLYLITSPAVRAENLKFRREGLKRLVKDVFLPWLNAFKFFEQCTARLQESTGKPFTFSADQDCASQNRMDRWILAFTQQLLQFVHTEMDAYRLYTVVPRLLTFVDNLTNWYVRFNRQRLKGKGAKDGSTEDQRLSLCTLGEVLLTLSKLMSPFTPFFSEWVYQRMLPYIGLTPYKRSEGPRAWDSAQVVKWLESAGLEEYAGVFQENGMRGLDLFDLTHEDLQSMGVARCSDRKAVLRTVGQFASSLPFEDESSKPEVEEHHSIHFQMIPQPKAIYNDEVIVRAFDVLKRVIDAGRILRDQKTLPVKYPLSELVVIAKSADTRTDLLSLEDYVKAELNVQKLTLSDDEEAYHVQLKASPDFKKLGQRFKKELKAITAAVKQLTSAQLREFQSTGSIMVCDHELTTDDINLSYDMAKGSGSNYGAQVDGDVLVLLDVTPTAAMVDEGTAREFVNRVQRHRKKQQLDPETPITVFYNITEDDPEVHLAQVLAEHTDYLAVALDKNPVVQADSPSASAEKTTIKNTKFTIWVEQRA